MGHKMKKMIAVFLIAGILVGANALSCYQCVDMDISTTSDELKKKLDDVDLSVGQPLPSCDSANSTACEADMMDTCTAVTVGTTMERGGHSATITMIMKSCAASSVADSVSEEKLCEGATAGLAAFGSPSCKLETCTTDGCNNQEISSSGLRLKISFLLAAYTALVIFN